MNDPNIIIGAGAAGLMAARELSGAGLPVVLLEAAPQAGGRIHTIHGEGFTGPAEAGAEFVHGRLPVTMQLLKEAGIPYHPINGGRVRIRKGKWVTEAGQGPADGEWSEMMDRMQGLTTDMPLAEFLSANFPGDKYADLRSNAKGFAEGYDLANIQTASTMALCREWEGEEHGSYHIEGGYGRLIDYLVGQCRDKGCGIHFSSPVKNVIWEKGRVRVVIAGADGAFRGSKLITTVSLGVFQKAGIQFAPDIPAYVSAAGQMGFGNVIKILLQFRSSFWNKKDKKARWFLSDEVIPTWWAGYPENEGLLIGWLTGSPMNALQGLDEASLINRGIASLSSIFGEEERTLKDQLVTGLVRDWSADPFVLGGYSFDTIASAAARKLINQPLEDTLFFAGEALYEGAAPGTVEAALNSGKVVAEKIIQLVH